MTENIIILIVTIFGFPLIIYFMKKWISGMEGNTTKKLESIEKEQRKIKGKVENMVGAHHTCREELPRRFADKKKTEENFGKMFDKMGEVAEGVAHIKGKIG